MPGQPELIGLDWGTTSVRAYLLGDGGAVLDHRSEPWGVMSLPGGDFGTAFEALVAHWDRRFPGLPALACGMIGSTEGWVRAPYCPCPAGAAEFAGRLTRVPHARPGGLYVVPGVERYGAEPNVMRGEETQIAGALSLRPELAGDAVFVLPGTHSKWVDIRDARIVRFDTYMTGELYALLAQSSILGRPARTARERGACGTSEAADAAFDRAVRAARESGARGGAPLLFGTRALVLAGALAPEVSLDYLSGLLIGEELRSALTAEGRHYALIGDPLLCARYGRAFTLFDIAAPAPIDDAAPAGLWRIARRANLAGDAIDA